MSLDEPDCAMAGGEQDFKPGKEAAWLSRPAPETLVGQFKSRGSTNSVLIG